MTISDVSPKKPSSAFPKVPDGWKATLYQELNSGSLEFPVEDVEVVETSGTDDDVTKELSLDNLIVAEANIGVPEAGDLSVVIEETSEDVADEEEASEDVTVAEEDSDDVISGEEDSENNDVTPKKPCQSKRSPSNTDDQPLRRNVESRKLR
ncbi:unnamed protein product [Caenorhabditis nigoni]